MDVAGWLRKLGLEQYEQAFRANEIDERVLPSLTAEDLRDLGVTWSDIAGGSWTPSPRSVRPSVAPSPTLPRPRGREGWGPMPSGGS